VLNVSANSGGGSSFVVAAFAFIGAPQLKQNALPCLTCAPQCGQIAMLPSHDHLRQTRVKVSAPKPCNTRLTLALRKRDRRGAEEYSDIGGALPAHLKPLSVA
jgi:hypothetical protein